MLEYLLCLIIRFLSFWVSLFPISFSLFLARCLGTVSYYLFSKKAKLAYLNLKLAFEEEISFERRKRIIKELFRNLLMNLVEFLYFPYIDGEYINKYIRIIGEEKVGKVLERGKGLILLTAHFGNWELSSLVAQLKKYPMVVLARQQKPEKLNSLLNQYRSRYGTKIVIRGSGMRELLRTLKENKVVGILGDQKSGKSGILVKLFSRLAWTPTGVVELSRHTNAGILPIFIIRERGPYHRIEVKDELIVNKEEEELLRRYHLLLEETVRSYPEQWLWFHRRWKGSPNKDIIILSDGKAGHLNQARSLAKIVKEAVEERYKNLNLEEEIVRIRQIEIKYKNIFTRFLVNLFGVFAGDRCRGCLKCLKICLKKESYDKIISFYGDIIISSGINLSAVNLFLAKENQAKSFIIMKSGLIPLKRFDLAVIPFHDRPKRTKNVVITEISLNLIDEEEMNEGIKRLYNEGYRIKKDKFNIGVLIGGDTKNYSLTTDIVERLMTELLNLVKEINAQLLITTSRRTPETIDKLIKNKLLNNPYCPLLIIANEKNIEKAVAGILGLSDVVVVSEESISMISEAISSNKPVIVFEIKKKIKKYTKHQIFLENLKSHNYISLVKVENISQEIRKIREVPFGKRFVEEKELFSEKIREIIG